jgi:hypothetical protein
MQPTIAPGTALVIRCTDDVKIGDVIVYVYLDQVAVHRLIRRGRGWMLTRGDAHVIPDAPLFDAGAIIGRVERIDSSGASDGVPPPPQTLARRVALWPVSAGSLLGGRGVAFVIFVLQWMSAVRGLLRR